MWRLFVIPVLIWLVVVIARPPFLFPEEAMLGAVWKGDTPSVQRLLRQGVPVETRDPGARGTLLITAARRGHVETTRVLLEAGANADAQNIFGNSALLLATEFEHPEVVRLLLRHGANPNIRSKRGQTPLSCALKDNDLEMARLLKKAGARE